MFFTRLISGISLVIIALVTILAGNGVLAAILCLISIIAYKELTKACNVHTENKKCNAPEIAGMIMTVVYYVLLIVTLNQGSKDGSGLTRVYPAIMIMIVISLILYLFIYVFTFPAYKAPQIMAAMFSWLYAPVMLSFIYLIREGFIYGNYLVWLVFLCSWGSDTCAYAVGVLFGKHKMTPKLSPKKSVEGAVGGVAGAALLFVLYTHFAVNQYTDATIPLILAAVLGAVGALVSMVGDLAASAIKRDHDIKDYGKLIPGHGGIMDRFDSVIIAAPLIFIGLIVIVSIGKAAL
ncbi:MAG: phosphatidate cytidylyltransferase [Lachnospiraceae bacterium]|nr:phosphatidate cytidylyltransferase [Lachnospiraceae bacterium]